MATREKEREKERERERERERKRERAWLEEQEEKRTISSSCLSSDLLLINIISNPKGIVCTLQSKCLGKIEKNGQNKVSGRVVYWFKNSSVEKDF